VSFALAGRMHELHIAATFDKAKRNALPRASL
jgi:hypothetical protein